MTLIRALRNTTAVNLLIAIACVAAYIVYGLSADLPIDKIFLGIEPTRLWRRGGTRTVPWMSVAVVEALILFFFVAGRLANWNMAKHRFFCGLIGFLWAIALLFAQLPRINYFPEDQSLAPSKPFLDSILSWYVWGSHLLYGLIGPSEYA
jgi:hypothetical protein